MTIRTRIVKPPKPQARAVAKKRKVTGKSPVVVAANSGKDLSVRDMRERLGVSRKIFSRVVGFSERAIADWESGKALSDAGLQRMRETDRLQKALAGVMRGDFVAAWLSTPNAAFAGLKPLEIIERGEVDRIWRMIYQLESGMPT